MMKQRAVMVLMISSLVWAGSARADDPSMAGDKAELQMLKARLEKLLKF